LWIDVKGGRKGEEKGWRKEKRAKVLKRRKLDSNKRKKEKKEEREGR